MMRLSQMKRFVRSPFAAGVLLFGCAAAATLTSQAQEPVGKGSAPSVQPSEVSRLPFPKTGKLPVAIVVGKDAEVLDFCGPLEVFANAFTSEGVQLFEPYLVARTLEPVRVGGGMKVVPDYTFKTAPAPKVIVIPAMSMDEATPEMSEWIRTASKTTDVTMSVCNGAFVLAKTGLLSGKQATAHHGGYYRFAGMFPDVRLKRGARFVEDGNLASAGGVSSGIDLALRVVQRYVGPQLTEQVADGIEYQGRGWLDPDSNKKYAILPRLDGEKPLCPLCLMEGDPAIKAEHKGKTYHFCAAGEKQFFETHRDVLDRFLAEDTLRQQAK